MGFIERKWGQIPQSLSAVTCQDKLKKSNPILAKYYKTFVSVNRFMPTDRLNVIMHRLDSIYGLKQLNQRNTLVKKEEDGETFMIHGKTIKFWYKEFIKSGFINIKYNTMYHTESGIAGTGIITYDDKTYVGEIKNGISDGKGTIIYDEHGSKYEGDVYDEEAHGYGEYKYNDKYGCNICRGYFRYDLQHGYGEQYYSDGSYYKGEFKRHSYHGKGLIVYKNGDTFEGEFINDDFHNGILRDKNGNTIRNVRNGQ